MNLELMHKRHSMMEVSERKGDRGEGGENSFHSIQFLVRVSIDNMYSLELELCL